MAPFLSDWFSGDRVELLGWTLVHFLWQGSALAALLYSFGAFTRRPQIRYAAAVATLGLMAASPLVTFVVLAERQDAVQPSALKQALSVLTTVAAAGISPALSSTAHSVLSTDWLAYFVWGWAAGVAVFGIRALGGCLLLRRLMQERGEALGAEVSTRCAALQKRLGLARTVRFFQSKLVDSPAVTGWFRPVVLIPMSALTGLSPRQLEAVIAHELAHIKRLDCFVNLFQVAVETTLFYHPAIWWVNRTIRNERENCCDDIAVAICGDPGDYARALTLMEGWCPSAALLLGANGGSLRARVGRLLGLDVVVRSFPHSGLALVTCVCVAGALFAGTAYDRLVIHSSETVSASFEAAQTMPAAPEIPATPAAPEKPTARATVRMSVTAHSSEAPAIAVAPEVPAPPLVALAPVSPLPPFPPTPPDYDEDVDQDSSSSSAKSQPNEPNRGSYIEGLNAAGLGNLDVDQLIALKVQGVTPEYVRELQASGLKLSAGEIIAMKVQGISPDYVRKVRSGWPGASIGEIIAMKVQGVDPAQAAEFRQLGLSDVSLGQLIAFKVQGVTPEYIRALRAAGFKDLSTGQIIGAKVQGITPEFVQKVGEHGFTNLSLHQLIALKVAGVF